MTPRATLPKLTSRLAGTSYTKKREKCSARGDPGCLWPAILDYASRQTKPHQGPRNTVTVIAQPEDAIRHQTVASIAIHREIRGRQAMSVSDTLLTWCWVVGRIAELALFLGCVRFCLL